MNYHNLLLHSAIGGRLGLFPVLTAQCCDVQSCTSRGENVSTLLLGVYLGVELPDVRMSRCGKYCPTVFLRGRTGSHSPLQLPRRLASAPCLFPSGPSGRCVVPSHRAFSWPSSHG